MLIPYLMKVSLVLAVLTLAYRWLIQFETFSKLNRMLLWLNTIAAWTLPLVSLPNWGPVNVQTEFHHTIPRIVGKVPVLQQPITTIQSASIKAATSATLPSMTTADWILAIYLLGVVITAAYFLFQLCRLFVVIARGHTEPWKNGTAIIHIPGTPPSSFFKWIILDPTKHSHFELQNIIAHEVEHARQWHSLDLLLAETQRICLWFNPFTWIHKRLVQENLEYLADKAVLNNGFEKKRYQYTLLNAVMQTNEFPLTNSFAQSLLKKRIKMINKKPSHYLAWGKYAAVLALVYVCSAFVAPYRERLIALAPTQIKPIVETMVEGTVIKDMVPPKVQAEPNTEATKLGVTLAAEEPVVNLQADEQLDKKIKGIMIRNDTLYWAITPLTTWDEINVMKQEFKNFDYELVINKLQFDPLQSFITSISVHVQGAKSSGTGSRGEGEISPMQGYSGFILKGGLGMGQLPPAPLRTEMEADHQKALKIRQQKDVEFFEVELTNGLGPNSGGSYTTDLFDGERGKRIFAREGIGKSDQNTLMISDKHKEAVFYLNRNSIAWDEVNKLPIDQVEKVSFRETSNHKMYFIIYTK